MYADGSRGSVPPERLVPASVLQVLYLIRSERLLTEQLHCNPLFRWCVGLSVNEPVWYRSTLTKNRERLIESWAALKSMRRCVGRDEPPGLNRSPAADFRGERRRNETHVAPQYPEAKQYRKARSAPAQLRYLGHVLMGHRAGLPIDVAATEANGLAEREAALPCSIACDRARDARWRSTRDPPAAESRGDVGPRAIESYIAEFRSRPTGCIVESYRMNELPEEVRKFWSAHHQRHPGPLPVLGSQVRGQDGRPSIEILASGRCRWMPGTHHSRTSLRTDATTIEPGGDATLMPGVHQVATDPAGMAGTLSLDLQGRPADDLTSFNEERQLQLIASRQ